MTQPESSDVLGTGRLSFTLDAPFRSTMYAQDTTSQYVPAQSTMSSTAADFALSSLEYGDASQLFNDPSLQWPSSCDLAATQTDGSHYQMSHQAYACEPDVGMSYPMHSQGFRYEVAPTAGYCLQPASVNTQGSCPRSFSDFSFRGHIGSMMDAYPPSVYQLTPQNADQEELYSLLAGEPATHLSNAYENTPPSQMRSNPERAMPRRHRRPLTEELDSNSGTLLDTPAPDDGTRSESGIEEAPIDKEEPYAQLLNRCLREAPGHTMILRDIYHWFARYTDKSHNKETKGWQNSIRHNLSMNAVCITTLRKYDLSLLTNAGFSKGRLSRRPRNQERNLMAAYRGRNPKRRQIHNALPQQDPQQARRTLPASRPATSSLRRQRRASRSKSSEIPTSRASARGQRRPDG